MTEAVAFALQELAACWNQAYEALVRGDLERTAALLEIADGHVAGAGDPARDDAVTAAPRAAAFAAWARLEHGMAAGLQGLRDELGKARRGGKALRGYAQPLADVGERLLRSG